MQEEAKSSGPLLPRVLPLVPLALFAVALWLLYRELGQVRYEDVLAYLRGLPAGEVVLALLFTAAGYAALVAYDLLGFRHAGAMPPLRRIGFTAFVGYSFSNTMGHALLTSTPLRFRLYSGWGVPAEVVARVVALSFVTFWVGLFALGGVVFTLFPGSLPPSLQLPFATERPLGVLFLVLVVAYVAACARSTRPLRFRSWEMPLPRWPLALGQTLVGSLDWALSAAVLYVLLPESAGLSFLTFLPIFLLAQILGFLSQVPGGLGVFETTVVLLLGPWLTPGAALGALVAYRALYYLTPFFLSVFLLAGYELVQHRVRVQDSAARMGRWISFAMPQALAFGAFVSGALLLFSNVTPTPARRLAGLAQWLPLELIEASHFLASIAGMGLILLARGLQRHLDAAYHLTLWLLGGGVVLSLAKGLDWPLALVLAALLVALYVSRDRFHIKASLFEAPFTPGWIAAIALTLGAALWLTSFAFRHTAYSGELWWRFALLGEAPRALRAMVGAAGLVLAVGAARLLRPAPPDPDPPEEGELQDAASIVQSGPRAAAWLAMLGDKRLLFDDDRRCFVMFGVEGRSWISLGDPVGPEDAADELTWRFRALAERHGGWPVFYQVAEDSLARYVEMGLTLLKIGEEGKVDLHGFSLEGSQRKDLRQAQRKGEKDGCSFEVLPLGAAGDLEGRLREISDAWLSDKNVEEKGFSLGFFDLAYLTRFPLAVVRQEGEIIAFTNVLGASTEELSVDLMRYVPTAPPGVMTYLFTELMLWGKAQGFRWFSMGMAPLSGLEQREGTPLWNRLGGLVYRHGEHFYNFHGLRQYKEKFDPTWEGRYLAAPGGLALPQVLTNVTTLIAGGIRGVFSR